MRNTYPSADSLNSGIFDQNLKDCNYGGSLCQTKKTKGMDWKIDPEFMELFAGIGMVRHIIVIASAPGRPGCSPPEG